MPSVFEAVGNNDINALKECLKKENSGQDLRGALVNAAELGHFELVRCFIAGGVRDEWAIVAAAAFGHTEIIRFLFKKGGGNLRAALITAAAHGHEKAVRFLAGKAPEVLDEALADAALRGYLGIVRYLVQCGADPNARVYNTQTPQALACKNGHREVCDFLKRVSS